MKPPYTLVLTSGPQKILRHLETGMVKFDDASVLFYFSNINYVSIKGLFWALNCGPLSVRLNTGFHGMVRALG